MHRNASRFGLVIPLVCAFSAQAETRQFANIIYDLPSGWKLNGREDGRLELRYATDDGRCDRCHVWIDPGAARDGPILAWRDAIATELLHGAEIVGQPQERTDRLDAGPVHVLLRQVDDNGAGRFQALFAIELPQRNELLAFEGAAYDQDSFGRSLATLNADITPMLNGLRFVSEGAVPVLGSPQQGDLSGPWYGTAIRNRYNGLSGTLEMVVDDALITFWPDGRFYAGIPDTGSAPLDVAARTLAGETGLGNYHDDGDDIVLDYVDGDRTRLGRQGETAIDWGGVTMYPASFPPDGFRFAGRIHSIHYTAFGGGVAGGVSGEHEQAFGKDGTFTDSSFAAVSGSFDDGGGFTGGTKVPESVGHYDIRDGIITQTPPSGDPWSAWIILDGGSDVIIGGQPVSAADE